MDPATPYYTALRQQERREALADAAHWLDLVAMCLTDADAVDLLAEASALTRKVNARLTEATA